MERINFCSIPAEVVEVILGNIWEQDPYVKLEEVCRRWQALTEASNCLASIKLRWIEKCQEGEERTRWIKRKFFKGEKALPSKVVFLLFEDQMDECRKLKPQSLKVYSGKLKTRSLSSFLLREEWIKRENLIHFGQSFPLIKIDLEKKRLKEIKEIFQAHQKNLSQKKVLTLLPDSLTRIPSEIGFFTGLETLFLPMSHIRFLPKPIQELKNLVVAHFPMNRIVEIPDFFWSLKNVMFLSLAGNQLTEVSEKIGQLVDLMLLDVSQNQLKKFPDALKKFDKLICVYSEGNPVEVRSSKS